MLWILSVRLRNVAIVDVAWGPAFVAAVATMLIVRPDPDLGSAQVVGFAAVTAWGLRLGLHLLVRTWGADEDRRYAAMRARDSAFAWTSLVKVFWLQAALVLVISTPLLASASAPARAFGHPTHWIGLFLFGVGLAFETVADHQLRGFKADPDNRGRVLDTGLWRYSRHPNYFGDFCVWWGLWIYCLPAPGAAWTVVSPVLMSFFLLRVSGVTLLESDIEERRPGYREYVRRTNAFFPGPPRKASP